MNVVYYGKISCSYLQYLLRYELFSPIFGQVRTDRQTDGQTDRQKAMHMSPPCNMHRWAQKWIRILKFTRICLNVVLRGYYIVCWDPIF